jgi:hypothetical protein
MKKFLLIILAITAMLSALVSCGKDEPINTINNKNTTSAVSTTLAEIYTPEDDYQNKYDGYMMSVGAYEEYKGYIPKSETRTVSSVPTNRKKTLEFNGVEYVLVYDCARRGAYQDYIMDYYFACHPDSDTKNPTEEKSFRVKYIRGTDKIVALWTSTVGYEGEDFYLDEMEEKKEYTEEELTEYAKKMAKEYIEKFGLDMNVDECVLRIQESPSRDSRSGKRYRFYKCLDGVPTNEYIRIDVNQFGKFMGAQAEGIGMYDEFANAKLDIDAIKATVANPKEITLLNDEGTLVAKVDCEVYVEYTPEEQDLGYPEAGYVTRTRYIPLVAKEIEK